MKLGYKSDVHLDFWVKEVNRSKIKDFIKNILFPKNADILILAGDIGHSNLQNAIFLEEIKKYYGAVLVTYGNHDLYLLTDEDKQKYKTSSARLKEFKEYVKYIEGVYFLDGALADVDGLKILGTPGWYDFSYAVKHGISLDVIRGQWEVIMSDAKFIVPKIDPPNFSLFEKEKIRNYLYDADIVFTHVPPLYIKCHDDVLMNSFYTFYGYDLFVHNIKYWVFGHCHRSFDFYYDTIRFLSSPLGYPVGRRGEFGIKHLNIQGV